MKRIGIIVGSIALIVLAAIVGRQMVGGPGEALPASSLESLPAAGSAEGFARATEPDAIAFPRDLGPHDDYQTEWWYYTGNLQTPDGRPFGFQFTIFRRALSPEEEDSSSSWRTEQVYLAHFTISDIAGEQFYPAERFSRGAVGLAGATAAPYRVWLEDWTIEELSLIHI